jgi:hypothetical protein
MGEILICDRLVQLIDPDQFRSGCVEYGATDNYAFENHLYEYETRNWKVLCLQPDEEEFIKLRLYRRLAKLIDCEKKDGVTIDGFLERTNVTEVKILLIKNVEFPSRVLSGFNSSRWGTEIISVQFPNSFEKEEGEKILRQKGFKHFEKVTVSDFYVKPGTMFKGEIKEKFHSGNLFEV